MTILYVLVPAALVIAGFFLAAFIRSAASGQFDDLETPAHRMLLNDERETRA